jgi:hypothetical protein
MIHMLVCPTVYGMYVRDVEYCQTSGKGDFDVHCELNKAASETPVPHEPTRCNS